MENKTVFVILIILDVALLFSCLFVCYDWFNKMDVLVNPCNKCIEKRPDIKPCFKHNFRPAFKINVSLLDDVG